MDIRNRADFFLQKIRDRTVKARMSKARAISSPNTAWDTRALDHWEETVLIKAGRYGVMINRLTV